MRLHRAIKYRTSFCANHIDDVITKEFQDRHGTWDLEFSMYEVDDSELARCLCEHLVIVGKEPPPASHIAGFFDIHGLACLCISTPTEPNLFRFASARHREAHTATQAHIIAVVTSVLSDPTRKKPVTRDQIKKYIASVKDDAEWVAPLSEKPWKQMLRASEQNLPTET